MTMKRKMISWLSLLIVLIFLGCREELDYFNEKQPQTSYNFSKENVITNILKKTDYEARPFLKPSVDFVNAYLKSQHAPPASSSAKTTAADISGIDLYTDVVEEVKYGNADYYSFYVRGKDENGFEQKLVVKAVNNQVVNKYLLRYKRINGFTIDPNSYQTIQWTGTSSEEGSLISSEHTVMVNCTVYTTINYDCGEGGHHVGMVCPTSHEYVPMPILVSYVDLNCLYAGETGGAGPSSGSSGTTGSTPGNSGGSSSGSGNPDFYVDDTSDPTPPLITLPTSAPLYDIKGQITGSIKNPPDFNPLNLTPAEIILINSKNEVRLELYKYLALHYAYPFSQGTILIQELIDYVKFVLQYFANHPNATWQDYYNDYLDNPCEKTKPFITTANAILHNPTVQQNMDAILKGKVSAPNEWAVAIGQKPDGTYEVTSAVEQNATNGSIPSSQLASLYIADGHSHAGNSGNPSGGDLYYLIKGLKTNYPDVKYRYVYGNDGFGNPEVYAFIVNDKNLAFNFLTQFPESENYDPQTHAIKETSELGEEFYKATKHFSEGRSENSASGENYDSRAIGMAYILDKYNAGISISKVDASGNLKKINVTVKQIVVPYSGGATKEGVKVSKCP